MLEPQPVVLCNLGLYIRRLFLACSRAERPMSQESYIRLVLPSQSGFLASHLAFIGVDKPSLICDTSNGFVSFIVANGRGCNL
jgi:hypothetical protein